MTVVLSPAMSFQPMRHENLPTITVMEAASYDFPWNLAVFTDCLDGGYLCRVLWVGDVIVGYGVLWIGFQEAHVLNICISQDWRGQGLGGIVLQCLLALAYRHQVHQMVLEVRPSNPVARRLYVSSGFHEIGRRSRYYPALNGREAAIVMTLPLR